MVPLPRLCPPRQAKPKGLMLGQKKKPPAMCRRPWWLRIKIRWCREEFRRRWPSRIQLLQSSRLLTQR